MVNRFTFLLLQYTLSSSKLQAISKKYFKKSIHSREYFISKKSF